jgi:hypothetical protein
MDDLISIEKSITRSFDYIKKQFPPFITGLVVGVGIMFFIYSNFPSKLSQANLSQNIDLGQGLPTSKTSETTLCESGEFTEKLIKDNWVVRYYDGPDEDGFYCPRSFATFSSPDIWYKKSVPTAFDSIRIRYQLKNKDNSVIKPPSFIFSIGDNPRILRFYVPEETYQIVGFEKIVKEDNSFILKRQEGGGGTLDEPIEYGSEAELETKLSIIEKNKAVVSFNLKYISALSTKSTENGFSYQIDLPFPNPESELSKLKIGFATFKGNCIKPISYKICPHNTFD